MLKFQFEQYNGTGVLRLQGNLTSHRADELREALLMSVDNSDHLMLNFEKVTRIDNFCVEQIKTIKRISKRLNKRFTMVSLNSDLMDMIDDPGLYPVLTGSEANSLQADAQSV